ncbi:MAG: hypothetical protein LBS89_05770 [Zoogloeaceae bacterium]|nr:hypothetical protein [Zoogloeaceae bacterium]
MKKPLSLCAVALALCVSSPVPAASSAAEIHAIQELGRISGVAQACRQADIITRIRHELDTTLAKSESRQTEETFVEAVKASFLEHQQKNAPCPKPEQVTPKIDKLFAELRQALRTR